jgi:trehalose 6-phosphate phosphatase
MHGTDALTVAPGPGPRPELQSTALFFDVDGTLLELQRRPEDVVADEALRDMIVRLQAINSGALALVSGRAIRDLDRIFYPMILPTAGLHGAEIRFPDGSRIGAAAALMDHARPDVGRFVAEHAGLMLEDKGATLAVHFRERPDLAADVLRFMTRFGPGDEIAVQEGKFVVELKPVLFDKGTAIATLLEHAPFKGRTPVFYGDDLTDEAGFGYVNKVGGLSVRIGEGDIPTEARMHLPNPAALREHLMELTRAASGEHGSS